MAGAVVVLAACALLLPRASRFPKQDFLGAREYVEEVRGRDEPVATVGLANLPYADYYAAGFTPVGSVAALRELLAGGRRGYVIYTFPIYMQSREPELWAWLEEHGEEVARFPGSIGDGDVVVLRL